MLSRCISLLGRLSGRAGGIGRMRGDLVREALVVPVDADIETPPPPPSTAGAVAKQATRLRGGLRGRGQREDEDDDSDFGESDADFDMDSPAGPAKRVFKSNDKVKGGLTVEQHQQALAAGGAFLPGGAGRIKPSQRPHRHTQFAAECERVLLQAVRRFSDPRLSRSRFEVTAVTVSPDLSTCVARWRSEDPTLSLAALRSAAGHLRSELAKGLGAKRVPILEFRCELNEEEQVSSAVGLAGIKAVADKIRNDWTVPEDERLKHARALLLKSLEQQGGGPKGKKE